MWRVSAGYYGGLEGLQGGVSNPGVSVSAMAEANLQGIIYYIKYFKRIGCTYTHADIEFPKVLAMYHQLDMEAAHNDPEVVPTVDPRDWHKTLGTGEEYIRGFRGVDGQPISYMLGDDLIDPVAANDPTYHNNGSEYFTHDEDMILDDPLSVGLRCLELTLKKSAHSLTLSLPT